MFFNRERLDEVNYILCRRQRICSEFFLRSENYDNVNAVSKKSLIELLKKIFYLLEISQSSSYCFASDNPSQTNFLMSNTAFHFVFSLAPSK